MGIEPDVKVPAEKALATAHLRALDKRSSATTNPRMRQEIDTALERLKKELAGM